MTRGFLYVWDLLDPKGNSGWLRFAQERERHEEAHRLPREFIYDYTTDYLPPQPDVVPYARGQNKAWRSLLRFGMQLSNREGPAYRASTDSVYYARKSLDDFTVGLVNLTSLYGDWPLSWAYYDEPSNREALLNGRNAHNSLLAAERLYAGLSQRMGFDGYPGEVFEAAWKANIWPDHGWGGNRGTETDSVYAESYDQSKELADELITRLGVKLGAVLPRRSDAKIPIAVYNSLLGAYRPCRMRVAIPGDWTGWALVDEGGDEVPCELLEEAEQPAIGESPLSRGKSPRSAIGLALNRAGETGRCRAAQGETMENDFFRLAFGRGGSRVFMTKGQNGRFCGRRSSRAARCCNLPLRARRGRPRRRSECRISIRRRTTTSASPVSAERDSRDRRS